MPLDPALAILRRLIFLLFAGLVAPALAGDRAGDFDFYVLSLSWTPAVCDTLDADAVECGGTHGFLVHGFWPEYESGHPEYCDSGEPAQVRRATLDAVADLIPDRGFAGYQWRKHGMCSGLSAAEYFDTLRSARRKVVIPKQFSDTANDARLTPAKVEAAFVSVNPGLATTGMAVRCANNTLTEVRICLSKNLGFRPCPEINADTCHASSISVQAVD